MSQFIKAPYNFVPLNKKVVIPFWSKHISHDIPFEDSQSGSFSVNIQAHSPIFVRDGVKMKQEENQESEVGQFTQFDGKYFIPGSSLKGMVRNVMEVMSFGGMANKVNDHRYSIRDLSPSAKSIYLDNFKINEIHGGWLKKQNDESYTIEDCDIPGRVSHRALDEYFKTNFSEYYSDNGKFDQKKDKEKAAQFKYQRFNTIPLQNRFEYDRDSAGRKIYKVNSSGQLGTLVFTGQAGPRRNKNGRWSGHHLEFIFFHPKEKKTLVVDSNVVDNFLFAYYDHDKNNWSEDWEYWRSRLNGEKKIPVFFRKNSKGEVTDFGLSYLYKLPYKRSIKEVIDLHQKEEGIDLADAIFGYIKNEESHKPDSLKGRVHIGHAWKTSGNLDEKQTVILSSPKASYYPNYIVQSIGKNGKVSGRYSTLMDSKPELAGWKRYPVHHDGSKSNLDPKDYHKFKKVSTSFVPFKTGATFEFKIRYHNLKKIELGALLSALTFHNTAQTFHSLGMAKPLGFGKVSLGIEGISEELKSECLKIYEVFMNIPLTKESYSWHNSPQISNLITMVSEHENRGNSSLKYMKLGIGRGQNDFVEAKQRNAFEALDRYTNLEGITARVASSLVSDTEVNTIQAKIEAERLLFENRKPISEQISDLQVKRSGEFYQLFEQKKAELIEQINQKRKTIATEENLAKQRILQLGKQQEAEERNQNARNNPPPIDHLVPTAKKAFIELKSIMRKYLEDFYLKKADELKNEFPNGGMLIEEHHDLIIKFVEAHIESRGNYDKKNWRKPFEKNSDLKKLGEWIGDDKAKEIISKILQ